ncbi:MAG TPA: transcriptional regulator GcvA [Methylomirabilota bacterium]|nr:transcriptional regulator GcvA [Methylomirabilota bacterium]
MAPPLPALGALRTFEAAARHLSFTRAADELAVTPAAVSHLVRELEDRLRVPLFRRTSRVVQLTPAGEILRAAVAEALAGIGRAVARLRETDGKPRLSVTAAPSFAIKWLVPRLNKFLEQAPEADVRVEVSHHLTDFGREDMDIGVRFGTGSYPELRVDRLFAETVTPVCSPKLMRGKRPLRHPRDLRHHTLIHVDWQALGETWPTWQMWMQAAGVTDVDPTRGIHFGHGMMAIQAAIDGQGVALGDASLAHADLAAGRLVRPFDLTLKAPPQFAYWIVTPHRTAERPLVQAFREWLLAEAAAMQEPPPRRRAATRRQGPADVSAAVDVPRRPKPR